MITEKETVVTNNDALFKFALDKNVSEKDQTIGAQREHIETLRTKISDLEKQLKIEKEKKEKLPSDQMVAVVEKVTRGRKVCPNCEYSNNATRNHCWDCGYDLSGVGTGERVLEYRNLDKVIENIRKEESTTIKANVLELEKQLDNTKFELGKAQNKLSKLESAHEQDITDARREVRDRYQKDLEEQSRRHKVTKADLQSKIDELVEEITKLEENKTDEQVEAARKQEVIDLKVRIQELEEIIEEAKRTEVPRMVRFWRRMTDRLIKREAEDEVQKKKDRIEEISNKYPKTTSNETPWWKLGKYAHWDSSTNSSTSSWFFPW